MLLININTSSVTWCVKAFIVVCWSVRIKFCSTRVVLVLRQSVCVPGLSIGLLGLSVGVLRLSVGLFKLYIGLRFSGESFY